MKYHKWNSKSSRASDKQSNECTNKEKEKAPVTEDKSQIKEQRAIKFKTTEASAYQAALPSRVKTEKSGHGRHTMQKTFKRRRNEQKCRRMGKKSHKEEVPRKVIHLKAPAEAPGQVKPHHQSRQHLPICRYGLA